MKPINRFKLFTLFFTVSLFFTGCLPKGVDENISAQELHEHVSYLASDSLQGRRSGSDKGLLSAQYIRDQFLKAGIDLGENKGLQEFEMITDVQLGINNSLILENQDLELNIDFAPYSFSSNDQINTEVVFCGYGFEIENDSLQWNDYAVDVKDKCVLIFRASPDYTNPNSGFISFEGERNKVLTAKDHGAAAVLFVSPVEMAKEDKLVSLYFDKTSSGAGIPVMHISRVTANKIIKNSNYTIEELEKTINTNYKESSFNTHQIVSISTDILLKKEMAQNVVAIIPGNDKELEEEYIIIGAHYDHLGMGGPGSGSRSPDTVAVHNGADDNASGVSSIIEMAEYFSNKSIKTKRTLIFVAFDAEEMGLLGSKHFTKNPIIDLKKVSAMFNFDMIGRLKNDSKVLAIGGTGTSLQADSILKLHLDSSLFTLALSPNGYGPSDHAAFYTENIPVFFFSTGAHSDYHTPFDDVDSLDFNSQLNITHYALKVIESVANHNQKLDFRESGEKRKTTQRANLKVTLGIIPDFSGITKNGLGIDGVRKGGPADLSGMQKGDVIIAIDGLSVGNIYDYMNRLKKLQPGKTITVEVSRAGNKKVLIVQL
ncbi:MAG: M20/M25/M40 family metallo-hydrolase [Bacteroidales bacterium]|nr:M20/M25/M40 family metallo-hydrolase [Bacteroidales bacterium]